MPGKREQLFDFVSRQSELTLPAVLESVVHLPAAMCNGDGCSIFLTGYSGREPVLYLAATTRRELRPLLFDSSTQYPLSPSELVSAAQDYQDTKERVRAQLAESGEDSPDPKLNSDQNEERYRRLLQRRTDQQFRKAGGSRGGLTSWVGTYGYSLRIADLTSHTYEGEASNADGSPRLRDKLQIPPPVWSDKTRGFFDWTPPRPFLAVPCMGEYGEVRGVVRVTMVRDAASAFTEDHLSRLKEFGDSLATFLEAKRLVENGPTSPSDQGSAAPRHAAAFRAWADSDNGLLFDRVTEAATSLFDFVDACSFFRRDDHGQFVIKSSYAVPSVWSEDPNKAVHSAFLKKKVSTTPTWYVPAPPPPKESGEDWNAPKTGYCLYRQEPQLMYKEPEKSAWKLIPDIPEGAPRPRFVDGANPDSGDGENGCELDHTETKALLFAPVRDTVNPRRLAGLLRAVVTEEAEPEDYQRALTELNQFAFALAGRLGGLRETEISESLTSELALAARGECAAIVAKKLEADAVTLFFEERGGLTSTPSLSFLNLDQLKEHLKDRPRRLETIKECYSVFRRNMERQSRYPVAGENHSGEARTERDRRRIFGRTLYSFKNKKVVRLKRHRDPAELARYGIESSGEHCELPDDGSFIAAPLILGGHAVGVVRALRVEDSPLGPFTKSHELILKTSTSILAERVNKSVDQSRSVAISYGFDRQDLFGSLRRYLHALGLETQYCEGRDRSKEDFGQKLQKTSVMIVLATERGSGLSAEIAAELGMNIATEGQEAPRAVRDLIVIREGDVHLPEAVRLTKKHGKRVEVLDIKPGAGLTSILIELTEALSSFGLLRCPLPDPKDDPIEGGERMADRPLDPPPSGPLSLG